MQKREAIEEMSISRMRYWRVSRLAIECFIDRFERLARQGIITGPFCVATFTCFLSLYVLEGRTAMNSSDEVLSIAKLKRRIFEEREGRVEDAVIYVLSAERQAGHRDLQCRFWKTGST